LQTGLKLSARAIFQFSAACYESRDGRAHDGGMAHSQPLE